MPPKRKLSSSSSSSSEASKRGRKGETVKTGGDLTTAIKAVEEIVKKKINEDLSSTQSQVLKTFAFFQQQKVKLESSLEEAKTLFLKYDQDLKLKDESIKTLKTDLESLKSRESANLEDAVRDLKSQIKLLTCKAAEEEFRANQMEDNMESLQEELTSLQEEKLSRERELFIRPTTTEDQEELQMLQVQCEDLRSKLEDKNKEIVELRATSSEKEDALIKCQTEFNKINNQIKVFLGLKEQREKEFSSLKAKHSNLSKKHQELQISKSEELTKINKKLDEAQESNTAKQAVIDKLTSHSENVSKKVEKLENKIKFLKSSNANLAAENKKSSELSTEKEKEARRTESKLLKLQLERREERGEIQSLEETLEERDREKEALQQKVKDISKRLEKKRDLIKKIENKSHDRKMRLKRLQETSLNEKKRKDRPGVEKKKVLTVKCMKFVLKGDESLSDQLKISDSAVEDKRRVLKESKVNLSNRLDDGDELLVEREDEKDHPDRDKYLKPIDVNLTCDDVIDTIENDSDNNVEFYDTDTNLNLNETDELSKIQEFLEKTELARSIIDDIISSVILHDSKDSNPPITASIVSGIMDKMFAGNTSQVRPDCPEMARPSELQHFYWRVRDTVGQDLLRFCKVPGAQLRISDET